MDDPLQLSPFSFHSTVTLIFFLVYGACVVPKVPPLGIYAGLSDIPLCQGTQITFPNGCVDYSLNYSACSSVGTWWQPAQSEGQCLSAQGCWDLRLSSFRTANYAFSPKNFDNCTSAYNFGFWKPYFDWSPALWKRGTIRKLAWIPREVKNSYVWTSSLDFTKLQQVYLSSADAKIALNSKSEVLCEYTRSALTLSTISCDCSTHNYTNCFSQITPVPVAVVRILRNPVHFLRS